MIKLIAVALLSGVGFLIIQHLIIVQFVVAFGEKGRCPNPECTDPDCVPVKVEEVEPKLVGGVLIATALLLLLAGCVHAPQPAAIVAGVTLPHKPNADFVCEDEPDPAPVQTDRDDAHYKVQLRHAWRDCRDKLGSTGVVWRATEAAQSRAVPPEGDEK